MAKSARLTFSLEKYDGRRSSMSYTLRSIIRAVLFFLCVAVVIYFQRSTGMRELIYMLLALGGIVLIVYDYNRYYQ